jgi:hypothetical protein
MIFRLNKVFYYLLSLAIIILLLILTGYFLNSFAGASLDMKDLFTLSFIFALVSALTFFIFLRGRSREPDSGTMHTLVSISLKFLLDITIALIWLIILKKSGAATVIVFFVIYLTFTLFTVLSILKILRNTSLPKI